MKNVIFTYTSIKDGESGEACAMILVEDDKAAEILVAFEAPAALPSAKRIIIREQANGFCWGCEHLRGRKYVDDSIKAVEVREA